MKYASTFEIMQRWEREAKCAPAADAPPHLPGR
jgi:hypothetical protein